MRSPLRCEPCVGDRRGGDEVRPAAPGAEADVEQHVRGVADGPAAPVVRALVDGEQTSVGQQAETVGVAQPHATSSSAPPSRSHRITAAVAGNPRRTSWPGSVDVPNGTNAPVLAWGPSVPAVGSTVVTLTPAKVTSMPGTSCPCGSRRSHPTS